jgi:cell division protein FtsB
MRLLPVLVALLSVGCAGRQFDPQFRLFAPAGKSDPKAFDNPTDSGSTVARPQAPPGELTAFASGGRKASPPPTAGGTFPPDPPPAVPAAPPSSWSAVFPDEHKRDTPTVKGERLSLNPTETGLDKAVELAKKIEQLQAENKALVARIALLEQAAAGREEAIAESVREVEAATVEVIRTRNELKEARAAVARLKQQMRQMEQDEIETLKAMIAALEKLLEQ